MSLCLFLRRSLKFLRELVFGLTRLRFPAGSTAGHIAAASTEAGGSGADNAGQFHQAEGGHGNGKSAMENIVRASGSRDDALAADESGAAAVVEEAGLAACQ